jgi:hypothetical protein
MPSTSSGVLSHKSFKFFNWPPPASDRTSEPLQQQGSVRKCYRTISQRSCRKCVAKYCALAPRFVGAGAAGWVSSFPLSQVPGRVRSGAILITDAVVFRERQRTELIWHVIGGDLHVETHLFEYLRCCVGSGLYPS